MEMSLYQIKNKMLELALNEEITEQERAELGNAIKSELLQKTDNIIGFIKSVEIMNEETKKEEERLKSIRKYRELKLENFKEYVKDCMVQMEYQKIETPLGEMKIAKNPMSVEITDEEKIPKEFIKEKIEYTVDKKGLLDHFKNTGEAIEGVKFNDNKYSLRIK